MTRENLKKNINFEQAISSMDCRLEVWEKKFSNFCSFLKQGQHDVHFYITINIFLVHKCIYA